MNKSKSISNENYLIGKNLVSYSPINFEENIITDPSVPPNGFINKLNNSTISNNENVINDNNINENVINDNNINENVINDNNINENVINDNDLNENNINVTNNNEEDIISEEVSLDEKKEEIVSESNTYSYATELIDNVARAPHNKREDSLKNEINKLNSMSPEQRANLKVRNEIMQIFPLSIIIALIIFILLLIYVVGFKV